MLSWLQFGRDTSRALGSIRQAIADYRVTWLQSRRPIALSQSVAFFPIFCRLIVRAKKMERNTTSFVWFGVSWIESEKKNKKKTKKKQPAIYRLPLPLSRDCRLKRRPPFVDASHLARDRKRVANVVKHTREPRNLSTSPKGNQSVQSKANTWGIRGRSVVRLEMAAWNCERGEVAAGRSERTKKRARPTSVFSRDHFSTFPSFCLRHVSVAISIFVSVSVSNFGGGFGRVKLRLAASVE